VANAPFPARYMHTSVVYDNKIWVMGGKSGASRLNDIWSSPDGTNWTQATPSSLFSKRDSLSSIEFNNEMWILAGWDGTSIFNDVFFSQ